MLPWVVCLLAAGGAARGEIRDVLRSAEIDAALKRLHGARAMHEKANFGVWLCAQEGAASAKLPDADQVFYIRRGSAKLALDSRQHEIAAGDVLNVPRGTSFRIDPGAGRLEYVAVRVFPATGTSPGFGLLAPRSMGDVVKKAQIDATFAGHDSNQPLHAAPNFTMNYVIYQGHAGPWEAHRGCVDIYFLHSGTATAQLGGEIQNPHEESPGEIRGTGVSGARSYTIGPGDIVVISRNTAHHMTPSGKRLDYLLLKVWAE